MRSREGVTERSQFTIAGAIRIDAGESDQPDQPRTAAVGDAKHQRSSVRAEGEPTPDHVWLGNVADFRRFPSSEVDSRNRAEASSRRLFSTDLTTHVEHLVIAGRQGFEFADGNEPADPLHLLKRAGLEVRAV